MKWKFWQSEPEPVVEKVERALETIVNDPLTPIDKAFDLPEVPEEVALAEVGKPGNPIDKFDALDEVLKKNAPIGTDTVTVLKEAVEPVNPFVLSPMDDEELEQRVEAIVKEASELDVSALQTAINLNGGKIDEKPTLYMSPDAVMELQRAFNQPDRPTWDEYFLAMIPLVGARATCDRGRSGCLIVSPENRILMSGYVGSPPNMQHCDEAGHEFEWRIEEDPDDIMSVYELQDKLHRHCIRTIHAEANAIYACARAGVSCEGATIYCTMTPCRRCAEAVVQSGIKKVVTSAEYHRPGDAMIYFEKAGVELITVGGKIDYNS